MGPSVECFLLYRHLKGSENTAPPQKKHDFGKGGGENREGWLKIINNLEVMGMIKNYNYINTLLTLISC